MSIISGKFFPSGDKFGSSSAHGAGAESSGEVTVSPSFLKYSTGICINCTSPAVEKYNVFCSDACVTSFAKDGVCIVCCTKSVAKDGWSHEGCCSRGCYYVRDARCFCSECNICLLPGPTASTGLCPKCLSNPAKCSVCREDKDESMAFCSVVCGLIREQPLKVECKLCSDPIDRVKLGPSTAVQICNSCFCTSNRRVRRGLRPDDPERQSKIAEHCMIAVGRGISVRDISWPAEIEWTGWGEYFQCI